ncbi:MAG TPA: hypothetical protein VLE89_08015 [Chlamydiales bacterium]|nr:hypothetical protein [Chlamydiales bacterium]
MSTVPAAGAAPVSSQASIPNPEKALTAEERTQKIVEEHQTHINEQLVPRINWLLKEVDSLKKRVKQLEDPQIPGGM